MKCQEHIHKIEGSKITSAMCDKELDIVEGNGINQYYDIVMKCSKTTGGCGFSKKMGNEKWLANHCQHCKKKLTDQEKIAGLTCGDCKDGGLT